MAAINGEHRGKPEPTDVLAFPVDGPEALDVAGRTARRPSSATW